MNYLSHYYFDQKSTDPYYILGIALPDLVKNHQRRWNIHPHKNEHQYQDNPQLKSIYNGWKRHLEVDHFFHEADYFIHKSGLITERMRTISFENNKVKPFMIGHIGLELMLDTLLIKNKKIEALNFYKMMKKCNLSHIYKFLSINGIEDEESFGEFYERFCEVQYLLSYQSNESIVYALNRIQYRLNKQYFTENDVRTMRHHIAELMDVVEQDYLYIFDQIDAHLLNETNHNSLPNI